MNKKPLVIISGPTATGKSDLAIFLHQFLKVQNFNSEIINFDSLLFYTELNIGTAKPTPSELRETPHHLINIRSIKNPVTAFEFREEAHEIILRLYQKRSIPILVGGSGFYLRALIKGMFEVKNKDDRIAQEIQTTYKEKGIAPIIEILKEHDPESLKRLHQNDHYRLTRAAEYFLVNKSPISEADFNSHEQNPFDFSTNISYPWEIFHIYLDIPKDEHLSIINTRTEKMMKSGLINEVKTILENGGTKEDRPLRAIGYQETIDYLQGETVTEDSMIERISISTRQLAKSQRTFFKKITPKKCYNPLTDRTKITQDLLSFLDGRNFFSPHNS